MSSPGKVPTNLSGNVPSTPRVVLASEVFPPQHGGSGRWLYEVYRRLPIGSAAVVAGEHSESETFDALQAFPIQRERLRLPQWGIARWPGPREYWRIAKLLHEAVRRHDADELHVARCLPEGFAAWIARRIWGIPYVVYVHGEETRTSATSRELAFLTRRAYQGARYLVANSRNTARILREEWSIPESRIRLLHPGVDTERFVPADHSEETRRELGWHDRSVVLTVGRLQIRKGQDMLIRALPQLRQIIPDVLYAVVGDGDERARLESLANELEVADCVRFHGELPDRLLVPCYQQCDVFALPNREVNGDFEGFGMVLVEAQACGKPVIAGDSGGTRETMQPDITGQIGDCNTPDFLIQTLGQLLSSPQRRQEMGEAAREWVVDRFSWPQLAQQACSVFAGVESVVATAAPRKATQHAV